MKKIYLILLILILLLPESCIIQFIPETEENQELLVADGLITDQPGENIVMLSKSLPLGRKNKTVPLKGCTVTIVDDLDRIHQLSEKQPGTYVTDPDLFVGETGRKYRLLIETNNNHEDNYSYESTTMEMKPVPPIDTIFYEKKTITQSDKLSEVEEGCQVYLNTYDPSANCEFYRWEFTETWEIRIPYDVPNNVCWITERSARIHIKSTTHLEEDRINRYPLNFISNKTDRLRVKYSMLVNQYSLEEDEYLYWEKMKNVTDEVGGLYDITPATIPSNISCVEDPFQKVLGYFSVSAKTSRRIFVKDHFFGIANPYTYCPSDTIYGMQPIEGLNVTVWVIVDMSLSMPPYRVITQDNNCYGCTLRGSNIEPPFWRDDEK